MRILSADDCRAWDQFTIQNEPVSPIDLMERAAAACALWISDHTGRLKKNISIFCGKGNNGGDGLALARMLAANGDRVSVFVLESGHKGTPEFEINLEHLHQFGNIQLRFIQSETNFPSLKDTDLVIDALFGSGLNRPLELTAASLAEHINRSGRRTVAIDLPSGMSADKSSKGNVIVRADDTLSFQCYKPAFLYAENSAFTGKVHILDIGLLETFRDNSAFHWIDLEMAAQLYKPRDPFAHKGNFGHALLLAGSHGKMGAAILAARACLSAGCGLLTACVPASGYEIIQVAVPEAMAIVNGKDHLAPFSVELQKYNTIAAGPGIGTDPETAECLERIFKEAAKPMVLDADALNLTAQHGSLFKNIPVGSILTPHPKEFDRLFGNAGSEFERIETAKTQAAALQSIIILKGHHTLVAMPGGQLYFNGSGNAGMAKGGSGDVLTGLLTGLLASGYTADHAAILSVYLHGLAGDLASEALSQESMNASDIIDHLGPAFKTIADTHL